MRTLFSKLFGKIQCHLFRGQRVSEKIELGCEWGNIPFLTQICTVIFKIVLAGIVFWVGKTICANSELSAANKIQLLLNCDLIFLYQNIDNLLLVDKFTFLGRLFIWSFNFQKKITLPRSLYLNKKSYNSVTIYCILFKRVLSY